MSNVYKVFTKDGLPIAEISPKAFAAIMGGNIGKYTSYSILDNQNIVAYEITESRAYGDKDVNLYLLEGFYIRERD